MEEIKFVYVQILWLPTQIPKIPKETVQIILSVSFDHSGKAETDTSF